MVKGMHPVTHVEADVPLVTHPDGRMTLEIPLAIIGDDGTVLIDDTRLDLSADMQADLAPLLGSPDGIACAMPAAPMRQLPAERDRLMPAIQIGGFYHGSLIDGPGRRSVVRVQGCPIRCPGCYVPETHDASAGTRVSVVLLAAALLESGIERDGVTIIGGEPFAQAMALAQLVRALRDRQPDLNICVYTGYTLERLRSQLNPFIDFVLDQIDTLIDGPFVQALHAGAGPFTGSSNQRVLDMREHRTPDQL